MRPCGQVAQIADMKFSMSDDYNREKKQREIDEFFAQFDKISEDFNKSTGSGSAVPDETRIYENAHNAQDDESLTPLEKRRKTRLERLEEQQSESKLGALKGKLRDSADKAGGFVHSKIMTQNDDDFAESGAPMGKKKGRRKHKKYKLNWKKLLRLAIILCLICVIAVAALTFSIISKAPEIDPDNIYSLLSENSVLYDDEGNVIDSVFQSGQGLRTNVALADMPDDLINAVVAIEDKTFWDHNGFNVIRIFGAIKDAVFNGGRISGTSTLTQQLARNLYLADSKSERTLSRKITEAYYTVLLEKNLTKEQIIEAYLNTIYLGYNAYGVQAASQAYFSKDVQELTTLECAALAALPKMPDSCALVKRLYSEDVTADNPNILAEGSEFTYIYNGDASSDRRALVLKNMLAQKDRNGEPMLTQEEYDVAANDDLRAHMNPTLDSTSEISSYFADYVINDVIEALMEERNIEYAAAKQLVYTGGLNIYTTMSSKAQKIVEKEFANSSNFPGVQNLNKDSAGNVVSDSGKILLYSTSNFFDANGTFTLQPSEYEWQSNGDLLLKKGQRLNFYKTSAGGETDYSVEFKNMYVIEDGIFYSIEGGYINIAQQYKTRNEDGNLIISASFFTDNPSFFTVGDSSISLASEHYTMKQKVIQPQGAMVIVDYKTGGIKAMVGGRGTEGRLLYNRATNPQQPGSSIKPLAVYGPALQSGYEAAANGETQNLGGDDANLYGNYLTAASVIDDSPLVVNGKTWPKNWYNSYRGLYTLRSAVQQSVNVCSVKVFQQIGATYSVNFLKKMGITSVVESGETNDMNPAALALGGMSVGISPLEMASAYGTFPNGGTHVDAISYTSVTNRKGETVLTNEPNSTQVFNSGVAFIMTDILRSVVSDGLGSRAAISGRSVGGKTGTTNEKYDIWFAGFTPQYSAAIWIGNDVNIELSKDSSAAATLWSKIMSQVCEGLPAGSYPSAPSNVTSATIDTKSGLLASDLSSLDSRGTVRSEYFITGTVPSEYDNVHTYVTICSESGYLATPWCTDTTTAFGVKRPYAVSSSVGDIAYEVPHYYCGIHNLDTSSYPVDSESAGTYTWNGMELKDPSAVEEPGTEDGTDPNATDTQSPDETPGWLDNNTPGNGSSENGSGTDPSQGTHPGGGSGDGGGNGGTPSGEGGSGDSGGGSGDDMPAWL